jgi:hypothetical protein
MGRLGKHGRRRAEVGGLGIEDSGIRRGTKRKASPELAPNVRAGSGRVPTSTASTDGPFSAEQTGTTDNGQFSSDLPSALQTPNSDAVQQAGEQLRAALERNNQAVTALFTRMFEQVEQQTRRLADMERRAAELAGQIKGLKNP